MEYLAYSSMFDANETVEPELGLPEIQLRSLGISPTGYYGPVTERAVRNFQINNGLLVDGKVGSQTRIALGV